jgi:chemotaxis protein CheX
MTQSAETKVETTTQLVVHFVRSVHGVLNMMAHTKVNVGKPYRKTDPTATHDVSGIIGFSGKFVGSMVLAFKQETAIALASAFAGVEVSPDSPDFADAIGELANMIAGNAKKNFSGTLISVPSVVMGSAHIIARLQHAPSIVVPCETSVGSFAVEVNIKPM